MKTKKQRLELFKSKGFTYSPQTGLLFTPQGKQVEGVSGGYIMCNLKVNQTIYTIQGHILGWYLHYNEVPNIIDHINYNTKDNKITNLRSVTRSENRCNSVKYAGCYETRNGHYQSRISINGKSINLGTFKTKEEGTKAYYNAKKIYHIINE